MRVKTFCSRLTLALVTLLIATICQAAPVAPFDAVRFVDSIGVNIQLGGRSPGYADFARVKANLQSLGIRHVRNPLWGNPIPYAQYNDLAAAGIGLLVPTGYNHDGQGSSTLVSQLRNISGAVEGVEGVNEPDNFARQATASQICAYQRAIYTAIKGDPALMSIPVLAPSLGNPYANNLGQQLTDLGIGQYADRANSHAYPDIWMPEGHSWVTNLINWASTITPGKPQIMTETGYGYNSVGDTTAGIYTPRLLLDLFCQRGLERNYIYQLADIGDGFGGLYQSDGATIRAQGRAVKNLIGIFGRGASLPVAPLVPLNFTLSGDTSSLKSHLFQKRDGGYLLALWRAYDASSGSRPNVRVTLGGAFPLSEAAILTDLDSASFDPAGDALPFDNHDEIIAVGGRVVIITLTKLPPIPAATTSDFTLYQ